MEQIQKVHAREVFDSRGNPTVAATVKLFSGFSGTAIVPSGASTGKHEAVELRDGDGKRFFGKGVRKAVDNINTRIAGKIEGKDPWQQQKIDKLLCELDGTKNKSRLGANAILAVSLAVAKAAAVSRGANLFQHFSNLVGGGFPTRMPVPLFNVINGGVHADSGLDIQEFMLVPTGAESFSHAMQIGVEVFHTLKKILREKSLATSVGDEGGFAPNLKKNQDAIELILQAAEQAGHLKKVKIALDVAASEFFDSEKKVYRFEGGERNAKWMADFFEKLCGKFPICSIEDPLAEDEFEDWAKLTAKVGKKVQVVGDDLLVTNPGRIKTAIEQKSANALLVKLNQIGTLTETIQAILLAHKSDWRAIISHRSGETEDTTIADLAVGLQTGQIKTGSLCRGERICKFNRLLKIEELVAGKAEFDGSFL